MDKLTGHRISTMLGRIDHTYATSDAGHAWGCFGRSTGGAVLRSGSGDASIAACLAGTDGKAGILYAVTGLCHQAANRILHPAGITVGGARGYAGSVMFYGKHGRGPWPELPSCTGGSSGASTGGGTPGVGGGTMKVMGTSPQSGGPGADFAALLTELGPQLSVQTRARVENVGRWARDAQGGLVRDLLAERIAPQEYAERLQELFAQAEFGLFDILGRESYRDLFGGPPGVAATLIDPEQFVQEWETGRIDRSDLRNSIGEREPEIRPAPERQRHEPTTIRGIGTVKWIDHRKGFGFIKMDMGGEVFVDASSIQERSLEKGEVVEFEVEEREGVASAVKIHKAE